MAITMRVQQIDKGAWEVIDAATWQRLAGPFTQRVEARDALTALKNTAQSDDELDEDTSWQSEGRAETDFDEQLDDKQTKPARAEQIDASQMHKATQHDESQPSVFALTRRAKNFAALKQNNDELPAGLVDAFKPRGAGLVGLYFTTAAQFDTSMLSTRYALRCESHSSVHEVADKRAGREQAAHVKRWCKTCAQQ